MLVPTSERHIMFSRILLGVIVGAIGTNVALKMLNKTGGTVAGLGYLLLPSVANGVSFLTKPFWADLEKHPVADNVRPL